MEPRGYSLWWGQGAKPLAFTSGGKAFIVASYSNTLHTAGTFRGWRRVASAEKWLRTDNSQEWPDYYEHAIPVHSFDRVEKLTPDEVVEVEIDLFPVGLVFYPGEQLRLVISARNALESIMPGVENCVP